MRLISAARARPRTTPAFNHPTALPGRGTPRPGRNQHQRRESRPILDPVKSRRVNCGTVAARVIVAMSSPEWEHEEMLLKSRASIAAIRFAAHGDDGQAAAASVDSLAPWGNRGR